MSDLRSRTARSSARLVKQILRDMRWHAARLDDPASVESVLSMAGTLSESVKKLAQILDDPAPEPTTQPADLTPKIDIGTLQSFLAVAHGEAAFCEVCGGVRLAE